MAKIKGNFLNGIRLGNYSLYTIEGSDELYGRRIGGASKETIKTSPVFAKLRKVNSDFGGAGKMSGKIHRAMYAVTHLKSPYLSGRLTAVATQIQKRDTENSLGKQSILFSKYPHILDGYGINNVTLFDNYLKKQLEFTVSRDDQSATVIIPDLTLKVNFEVPAGYQFYRFITVLGIVPDLKFVLDGFEDVTPNIAYAPKQDQTDWIPVKTSTAGQSLHMQLNSNCNFDSNCSLILSVGIEFGKYDPEGVIKRGKKVGSAKILAQV